MRAEMLLARGKVRDAQAVLDQARKKFPKSLYAWNSLIGLTAFQLDNPVEGLKLLEQAKKELGDQAELRLEQARILAKKDKGSETLGQAIEALSENSDAFSAADQRKLWEGLANVALQGKSVDVAIRLFTQCVKKEPSKPLIHWKILNLAIQQNDPVGIESQIKAIKDIENSDLLVGTYAEARYLAWQADRPDQPAETTRKLRSAARASLMSWPRATRLGRHSPGICHS